MKLEVGDLVQIAETAVDVVTGRTPKYNDEYVEGRSKWGSVASIVENYKSKNYAGLVKEVTKVAVANQEGNIQWQVEAKDIAKNVIKASNPKLAEDINKVVDAANDVKSLLDHPSVDSGLALAEKFGLDPKISKGIRDAADLFGIDLGGGNSGNLLGDIFGGGGGSNEPYATTTTSTTVDEGGPTSTTEATGEIPEFVSNKAKELKEDPFTKYEAKDTEPISFEPNLLGVDMEVHKDIERDAIHTAMSDDEKREMMLNMDIDNIQNQYKFPTQFKPAEGLKPARYDYRIDINDDRYPLVKNMEDELMQFRASMGIPVHGNNDIARAMKYYMYNRFKTPDPNLAHTKSFTHVFFTRPDLNILDFNGGANKQARSNTESAMIWKRNPDLFKLLTDYTRCKDNNNFNMLLSNQCVSFDIKDETLSTLEAGRSWSGHEMSYGDRYMGNSADQFSCTFNETSDFSVINLIRLWIVYIDNVSRGAWSPSYNLHGSGVSKQLNMSHIYSRSLDYAASCYAFRVGPDGEDILYWTKYYGIFPINTGASSLAWSIDDQASGPIKLNISFRYSFKRDMSPVSLLEFNKAANIVDSGDSSAEAGFNVEYGHSSRPFVGAPYIEMKLDSNAKGFPSRNSTSIGPNAPNATLRLKFRKECGASELRDETMYRHSLINRSSAKPNEDVKSSFDTTVDRIKKVASSKVGRLAGSAIKQGIASMKKKSTPIASQPQRQAGYGGYSF